MWDSDVATVRLASATSIEIEAVAEGNAHARGEGTVTLDEEVCGHPAGAVLPVDFGLSLSIRRPATARILLPCGTTSTIVAAGGSPSEVGFARRWFGVTLVDSDGEDFWASNAELDAQIDVTLTGAFEASHAAPATLSRWVLPHSSGEVEIVAALGDRAVVDVVDAGRIVSADVGFELAGVGAGSLGIADGRTYGENGWGRAGNRLAPNVRRLATDAGDVCSSPPAPWFELVSLTPKVCETVPLSQSRDDGYLLSGDRTGQAARFVRDGECTLRLDAPGFAAAAGFPRTLSVTVLNVDKLIEL